MGIQNCVHRFQNNYIFLEIIEDIILYPQDFGINNIYVFLVFKFYLIFNYILFIYLIILK